MSEGAARHMLVVIGLVIWFVIGYGLGSITPASYFGDLGYRCKDDHTCHSGLTCVFDDHGHSSSSTHSICLDGRTMGINKPAQ